MGANQNQIVYAEPIKESKEEGFSEIYRNPKYLDRELLSTYDSEVYSLKDMLNLSLKRYGQRKCLGKILENKEIEHWTYEECYRKAEFIGSSMVNNKLCFNAEDTSLTKGRKMPLIGIYTKNRREWTIIDMACLLYGLTTVPFYDTLGVQNLSYCLRQTNLESCFCSQETAKVLLKLKDVGNLKNIILLDRDNQMAKQLESRKFKVYFYEDLISEGEKNLIDHKKIEVQPLDCHSFSYTSGTTGPPKGAMLSHRSAVCMIAAINLNPQIAITSQDRHISFLPLPHMYQRAVIYCYLSVGASITYFRGDMNQLKEDMAIVKPTVFGGVPRIFNRMYEGVQKKFDETTGIKKMLINWGLASKLYYCRVLGTSWHRFYDRVLFSKTKQLLGGSARVLITGSAPMRQQVHEFIKVIMCVPCIQGYGQTQNYAAGFIQRAQDPNLGHVGGPTSGIQFKLMDLPQMNYTCKDVNQKGQSTPRGEIWMRGPMLFLGYYKNPQKTNEAITKDGWLRTGDVGMLLPNSRALKIIDRSKNIFKLSQGEYVASEKIQRIYNHCPLVSEVFLHGQSTQTFCIAIVTPVKERIVQFGKQIGIQNVQENLNDQRLRGALCKQLNKVGKQAGLYGFEQAKNIFLDLQGFQNRGLTTTTFKLQRHQAKNYYKEEIVKMYKEGMLDIK